MVERKIFAVIKTHKITVKYVFSVFELFDFKSLIIGHLKKEGCKKMKN